MAIEVPLTQGLVALVDDADAELISQYKWHARKEGRTFYARRGDRALGRTQIVYMHTFMTGFSITDHINGNGLDNRRENLREVSKSENVRNSLKNISGSSRFKGVHWVTRDCRWRAQIWYPSAEGGRTRRKYLGQFSSEVDAALAYDNAAREAYGEYATLNFPKLGERSALTGQVRMLEEVTE